MSERTVHMALRGTSAALALLAVAQVLLAGIFLSGHYVALGWHLTVGMSMIVVALVNLVVALLPGRRNRPAGVWRQAIFVPVALALQGVLGMFRILELHVPIGVIMVVGLVQAASWAWRTPLPPKRDEQPAGVTASAVSPRWERPGQAGPAQAEVPA